MKICDGLNEESHHQAFIFISHDWMISMRKFAGVIRHSYQHEILIFRCFRMMAYIRLWNWVQFRLTDTRNSSGDEIVNVNFHYDDIVHILQNTIDSCINSTTDRRGYVSESMFTKFSKITQYNGHYVVQGHSRSPILVPIESSYTTSY